MADLIKCPRCGQKQPKRQGHTRDSIYYCPKCRGQFDDSPDEGGSYFSDPSKRLEREENYRANKQRIRR